MGRAAYFAVLPRCDVLWVTRRPSDQERHMRRQLAVLAALSAALTLAGPASALDVGVTEDEGNTNPEFVYSTLQDLGMTTNVMSIRWDPLNPLGLPPNFEDIKAAASVAAAHGVSIILATYQDRN